MPSRRIQDWGWLPAISVIASYGLVLVSIAYNGSRTETLGIEPLFWVGMSALILPAIIRLTNPEASRQERMGILLVTGLGMYLVKVLYSPLIFTFGDELQHWRTAQDIVRTGSLFTENSILPVSPLYPGLETITHALVSLGGLTIFQAGVILIGAARLVLVLALFLFYEWVGRSSQVAGIAALVYMSNPHFAFFDAQFSYESLALSFAAITLYAAVKRLRNEDTNNIGLTLIALIGLAGVVVTHHITSYMLAAFLILGTLFSLWRRQWRAEYVALDGVAALSIVGSAAWLAFVATIVIDYLTPTVQVIREVFQLVAGEEPARQMFRLASGEPAPIWVQLPGYLSVILILLWMPFGLREVWRKHRFNAIALSLALVAVVYPVLQGLRFTRTFGLTVLYRSSPYIFLGIGFILALGMVELLKYRRTVWVQRTISILSASVILLGTIHASLFSWGLPGPVYVDSYSHAVGLQGARAAEWARDRLGPGNRLGADLTNQLLMGSYGVQRPVTDQADRVWIDTVLYSQNIGDEEKGTLRQGRIRYLVVDLRLIERQFAGEGAENGEGIPDLAAPYWRTKFDSLEGAHQILDSGDIRIYDVGVYSGAK